MSKNKSANIVNMDTSNTTTQTASYSDDNVSADKPIITVYFKKPSGWSNELYAKLYQVDDSGSVVLEQLSEKLLITDDGNNFYIAVDTRRVNSIIISDKNSSSRKPQELSSLLIIQQVQKHTLIHSKLLEVVQAGIFHHIPHHQ